MLADHLQRKLSKRPLWAVGLMSGTSLDGVDAALLRLDPPQNPRDWKLVATWSGPFTQVDARRLRAIAGDAPTTAAELGALRMAVTREHERAVRKVCEQADLAPSRLAYVAAHGITLHHAPDPEGEGHTWQLHAGQALAAWLHTVVVDDFRSADVALGGHGAPLSSLCDLRLRSSSEEDRVILNLGGVANLSALPAGAGRSEEICAGDVGPANLLLDGLHREQTAGREDFDRDGRVASRGKEDPALVDRLLQAPWVRRSLPRSFGREQFGRRYLEAFLAEAAHLGPADRMATLVAMEARAVRIFLDASCGTWRRRPQRPLKVYLCGGGRHNRALVEALRRELAPAEVEGLERLGTPPDFKEAIDWALLGWLALSAEKGGTPPLTGAREDHVLGAVHAPSLGLDGEVPR